MDFLIRAVNTRTVYKCTSILRTFCVHIPGVILRLNSKYRLPGFIYTRPCSTNSSLEKVDDRIRNYFNRLMDVNRKSGLKAEIISEFIDPNIIAQHLDERYKVVSNMTDLKELAKDDEMKQLAEEESKALNKQLIIIDNQLLDHILDNIDERNYTNVILEITPGVGGTEAMMFVKDLYKMYTTYIERIGMEYETISIQKQSSDIPRSVILSVKGDNAYNTLKFEGGVHRVQRIPATEKSGRVHTSTARVVILPELENIDIKIEDKDLKIESKKASGAGGQHVNTTDSAIRIVHLPTGIMVTCQEFRSQHKNKDMALLRLRNVLYEQALEKQSTFKSMLTKKQRGMGMRNEKIRTYNYNQDRITDHRILDGTVHNITEFMDGGPVFEKLRNRVYEEMRRNMLYEIIEKNEPELK